MILIQQPIIGVVSGVEGSRNDSYDGPHMSSILIFATRSTQYVSN